MKIKNKSRLKPWVMSIIFLILLNITIFLPYNIGLFFKDILKVEVKDNILILWFQGSVVILVGIVLFVLFIFLVVFLIDISERLCEKFIDIDDDKDEKPIVDG